MASNRPGPNPGGREVLDEGFTSTLQHDLDLIESDFLGAVSWTAPMLGSNVVYIFLDVWLSRMTSIPGLAF